MGTMALPFLVLYLTGSLGFSNQKAASVLSFYGAVALLAGPLGGYLSDRWGSARVMEGSLFLVAVAQVVFPAAHQYFSVLIATFFFGLFTEIFSAANLSFV